MNIDLIKEIQLLAVKNPEYILRTIIEQVLRNQKKQLDLKLQAQLMLVLFRLDQIKEKNNE